MERVKQFIIILVCCSFAFLPVMADTHISYADDTTSGGGGGGAWTQVETHEQIVAAFKAYCQYRNYNITHVPNTVKAIVQWDYEELQKFAVLADIDLDSLNAHLWYAMETNKPLKFYLDSIGASEFNAIYEAIINENNIEDDSTGEIYSGKYVTDDDGYSCYCYVCSGNVYSYDADEFYSQVKKGTAYKYTGYNYWVYHDMGTYPEVISFNDVSYNYYLRVNKDGPTQRTRNYVMLTTNANENGSSFSALHSMYMDTSLYYDYQEGSLIIKYYNGTYYLGTFMHCTYAYNGEINPYYVCATSINLHDINGEDANINYSQGEQIEQPENKSIEIITDDDTINNYITNNNSTVTNNYYDDDEPPEKKPTPLPSTPDYPSGGTINPDGSINWTMPDLDIDFDLDFDLSNVFPFSIPFDIIDFFEMFETDPVAPHFQGTIDLGLIDYDLDIDLSYFDDVAYYIRTFILALYVFGLILATREMFHIY